MQGRSQGGEKPEDLGSAPPPRRKTSSICYGFLRPPPKKNNYTVAWVPHALASAIGPLLHRTSRGKLTHLRLLGLGGLENDTD